MSVAGDVGATSAARIGCPGRHRARDQPGDDTRRQVGEHDDAEGGRAGQPRRAPADHVPVRSGVHTGTITSAGEVPEDPFRRVPARPPGSGGRPRPGGRRRTGSWPRSGAKTSAWSSPSSGVRRGGVEVGYWPILHVGYARGSASRLRYHIAGARRRRCWRRSPIRRSPSRTYIIGEVRFLPGAPAGGGEQQQRAAFGSADGAEVLDQLAVEGKYVVGHLGHMPHATHHHRWSHGDAAATAQSAQPRARSGCPARASPCCRTPVIMQYRPAGPWIVRSTVPSPSTSATSP